MYLIRATIEGLLLGPAIVFHLLVLIGGILYGLALYRTDAAAGIILIIIAIISVVKNELKFILAFYACFAAVLFT
ncbi:MAG TPA: hypothetical protein ENJ04_06510 [Nitrospirae bacterium]|nr:hypothetical protein [Nitrospirota bacterium]